MRSLGDKEMRHGRKSQSKRFNGYKRHIVGVAGTDLIAGALVLPANEPEHDARTALGGQVKSGQRWTGQNRPTAGTRDRFASTLRPSRPATSDGSASCAGRT